jgi:hypothetical protein
MRYMYRFVIAGLILAGIGVAGWNLASSNADAQNAAHDGEPIRIEEIEGSELSRITLSEHAMQRLDIKTSALEEQTVGGASKKVIPYSAVLYDSDGKTWTYVNTEAGIFVRAAIEIESIEGDSAFLSDGPESGTVVVATGAAELFGAEQGVGGGH